MKIVQCALTAALLTGCGAQTAEAPRAERSLFAMNTYMTFTAYGEGAAAALESASQRIEALESLWSVTDAESEIYRANHSGGEAVEVTDEGEILVTEGIADRFTLNEGRTETVRVLEA